MSQIKRPHAPYWLMNVMTRLPDSSPKSIASSSLQVGLDELAVELVWRRVRTGTREVARHNGKEDSATHYPHARFSGDGTCADAPSRPPHHIRSTDH